MIIDLKHVNEEKVVLVTGTNGKDNIGASVERKFRELGWTVLTCDLFSTYAVNYRINVTNHEQIFNMFENIKRNHGRLDAVISCHGVNILGAIESYSELDWDTTINVNLKSLYLLLQRYVSTFDNDGRKKVFIPITSDTAEIPKTKTFAYGASKAGANHFLRCTARELNKYHKDQWVILGLAIGMVEGTPMDKKTINDLCYQNNITEEKARNMLTANIPIKRGMTPEEVAEYVYFFATKGDYATGNIIRIDAGQCQG
jgi:NAD(P)-dependent dehydrogenase (short-subunit alcohol dehydrogenase family)